MASESIVQWLPEISPHVEVVESLATLKSDVQIQLLQNQLLSHIHSLIQHPKAIVQIRLRDSGRDATDHGMRWYRLQQTYKLRSDSSEEDLRHNCNEMTVARAIDAMQEGQRAVIGTYLIRQKLVHDSYKALNEYEKFKALLRKMRGEAPKSLLPLNDDAIIQKAYDDRFISFSQMKELKILHHQISVGSLREYLMTQ